MWPISKRRSAIEQCLRAQRSHVRLRMPYVLRERKTSMVAEKAEARGFGFSLSENIGASRIVLTRNELGKELRRRCCSELRLNQSHLSHRAKLHSTSNVDRSWSHRVIKIDDLIVHEKSHQLSAANVKVVTLPWVSKFSDDCRAHSDSQDQ